MTFMEKPTATQWLAASKALKAGNREPVIKLLQAEDLPVEKLGELFEVVLAEADVLQATIKADGADEFAKAMAELKLLARTSCSSVDDAAKLAARVTELEKIINPAESRMQLAAHARNGLSAIQQAFPELFGSSDAPRPPGYANAVAHNAFVGLGLDPFKETWRDFRRPAAPRSARRRIIATGFGG